MNEPNIEEFSYFITQPDLKLTDVLLSPQLINQVRAKNSLLFNYFQQDSVIGELAEWCFTTKYKNDPKFTEFSEIAFNVFLSSTFSLISFLLNSKSFAKILYTFLITDDSKNPRLCGHFSEVLSLLIKFGTPTFFTNFSKVQTHLLKRIEMLGISDLIINLILLNVNYIDSEQIIKGLSYDADINDDKDAIQLLVSLFEGVLSSSHLKQLFQSNSILNHLLNAAVKTTSPVIQSDILDFLSKINFQSNMINDQQLIEKVTLSEDNINDLTISAIDFLQLPIDYLVTFFFTKSCKYRFHQKIMSKMEVMNLNELIEIANIPDFVVKLINAFGTEDWCPHCLQIVIFFTNIENYCKPLKSKKWKTFIRDKFYPLIKIMNNEYGGHAPSQFGNDCGQLVFSDSDDLRNENEENETFEEEDEFYDDNFCQCEEEGCDVENIESSESDDVEFDIDI